jgi:hypothetical protein
MAATATASAPVKKGSGGFKSSVGPRFGTLEQVFDDVWWAWGTVKFAPGILFPRNMTIVREKGELVIIHAVVMPDDIQKQIEALGPIKHVVRLGAFHGMDDKKYVDRYSAAMWMPDGCDHTHAPATKIRHLAPGGELPISDASLFDFTASQTPETAIHLPRHGGVLLTCDSIQNWETTAGCSFLGGAMSRMMGFRGRACIGPGWRKASEPKDGVGFRDHFAKLLELDFKHVLSAHGAPMKNTARDDLRASVSKIYK